MLVTSRETSFSKRLKLGNLKWFEQVCSFRDQSSSSRSVVDSTWLSTCVSVYHLNLFFFQRCFNPALKIHDTSGVHFIFGLPGVLGALAQVVLFLINNWSTLPRCVDSCCKVISSADHCSVTRLILAFVMCFGELCMLIWGDRNQHFSSIEALTLSRGNNAGLD